ncbi:TIGR01777 family protein [Neolewinella aurantiaca]|uniref:TIGR01777 family protein n=1 Tax=Neolewinella aurantiaca TaxID=2602767 RepID=A0A5C7FH48_9BACT|nr:TIGR01777 family oxidoreductase [Neolewinella aurantiaca]TXF89073.1 TIGR01777 family protein [Neolewinella aurantiaca]
MSTILIGGGTGFIGKHLSRTLAADGHEVRILSRSARPDAAFKTFVWDVKEQTIDDAAFAGVDYVINLAGAGIVGKRWSEARKQVIINSRTGSTLLLATTMARLGVKPKLYLSASAIGYYGDRGNELLTEPSKPGNGFLSKSCVAWEGSVADIDNLNIPTCIIRTGIVLHPDEGALEKMLIPLNFWVSSYFGDGSQFYSWIHIDDMVNTYRHAISKNLTGIYNGVAPNPVTNKELARALGPAMNKSALVVPAPAFAMKLAMGEMSHTVLDSARCSAGKLLATGFAYEYPELDGALRNLLRS